MYIAWLHLILNFRIRHNEAMYFVVSVEGQSLLKYSINTYCLTLIHVQEVVTGDDVDASILPEHQICYRSLRPLSSSVFNTDSIQINHFEISENGNLVINAS